MGMDGKFGTALVVLIGEVICRSVESFPPIGNCF